MPLVSLESTSTFSAFAGAIISTEHHPVSLAAEHSSAVGELLLEHDLAETVAAVVTLTEVLTAFSPISSRSEGGSSALADLLVFYPLSAGAAFSSSTQASADLERRLTGLASAQTSTYSDLTTHAPDTLFSASKGAALGLGELTVTHLLTGLSEGVLGCSTSLRAEWSAESTVTGAAAVTGLEQYFPFLVASSEAVAAPLAYLSKVYELGGASQGQSNASTNSELRLIGSSTGQSTASANSLRVCLLTALVEALSTPFGALYKQSNLNGLVKGSSDAQGLLEPWLSLFSRTAAGASSVGTVEHEVRLASLVGAGSQISAELFQIRVHLLSSLSAARSATKGSPIGGWPVVDDLVSLVSPLQRPISLISRRFS